MCGWWGDGDGDGDGNDVALMFCVLCFGDIGCSVCLLFRRFGWRFATRFCDVVGGCGWDGRWNHWVESIGSVVRLDILEV